MMDHVPLGRAAMERDIPQAETLRMTWDAALFLEGPHPHPGPLRPGSKWPSTHKPNPLSTGGPHFKTCG